MKKFAVLLLAVAMAFMFNGTSFADLNDGLIAYFPFDGNPRDMVSGNLGLEYGGIHYVEGMVGRAASFDGVNDYIDFESDGLIIDTANNNYSIAGWYKPESGNGYINVIGTEAGIYYSGPSMFWYGVTNKLLFYCGRTVTPVTPDISIEPNKWYHFVGISNNDKTLKLYINGVYVGSGSYTTHVNSPVNFFRIGGKDNQNRYVKGSLDELRIYNRSLSEAEILELYQNDYIYLSSITENYDIFPPTLSISGTYYSGTQTVPNTWIGADDPIGQECNEKFIQTDSNGIFTKTWDTTNVKPGIYQLLLYTNKAKAQISIPLIANSRFEKYYEAGNININVGRLLTAGFYKDPITFSCSFVSGDCQVLKPTLTQMKEDLKEFKTFMFDWHANFWYDVASNSVNQVAGAGVLTCFVPSGITQATTCPASITFLTASAAKSAVKSFAHTSIDYSDLSEKDKELAHLTVDISSTVYSFIVFSSGGGVQNALEVESASFQAAKTLSYVEVVEDSEINLLSTNTTNTSGVFIVAERTDGTVAVIAIYNKAKPKAMPWIPLLLLDD